MTTSLQPCPSCSRHIRITEESCPFCAASVAGLLKAAPSRKFPGRLSRAALIAASTLVAVPACGGEDENDDDVGVPVYGAAPTGGADMGTGGDDMGTGGDDTSTGGDDMGTGGDVSAPEYGISPAGGTGGNDQGTGGAATGTGGAIDGPVYGAPPTPPN